MAIEITYNSITKFVSFRVKLWADGDLRDLLVDSGVYAGNTLCWLAKKLTGMSGGSY
jgi:hypothetical protein